MNEKLQKLSNPIRVNELSPLNTLRKIGVEDDHIICDIGAGTGVFTIPSARLTKNTVFAIDINNEALDIIKEQALVENLSNIKTLHIENNSYKIDSSSVDLSLLVTVFHELPDKEGVLSEIKRVLKSKGKLAVIEFHYKKTPWGPSVEHRISRETILSFMEKFSFTKTDEFELGENFYCIVFEK